MYQQYHKSIRPNGTDWHTGTLRWAPEDGPATKPYVVKHPDPDENSFDHSDHLCASTVPTDCIGSGWPARHLILERVEGHPVMRHTDNKRSATAWRVVEERPAHELLGTNGAEVAAIIERAGNLTEDEALRLAAYEVTDERKRARLSAWALFQDNLQAAGEAASNAAARAVRAAASRMGWGDGMQQTRFSVEDSVCDAVEAALVLDQMFPVKYYRTLMKPWLTTFPDWNKAIN